MPLPHFPSHGAVCHACPLERWTVPWMGGGEWSGHAWFRGAACKSAEQKTRAVGWGDCQGNTWSGFLKCWGEKLLSKSPKLCQISYNIHVWPTSWFLLPYTVEAYLGSHAEHRLMPARFTTAQQRQVLYARLWLISVNATVVLTWYLIGIDSGFRNSAVIP